MDLSERVRKHRRSLHLTQAQLAELMGVSVGTVKRLERPGTPPPSLHTLKALEEAFGWMGSPEEEEEDEDTEEPPTLFHTAEGPPTGSMAYRWVHLAAQALTLPPADLAPLVHLVESYLEAYSPE